MKLHKGLTFQLKIKQLVEKLSQQSSAISIHRHRSEKFFQRKMENCSSESKREVSRQIR